MILTAAPVTTVALFLAQQPGNGDNGGQGEDFGKSSPLGLLVVILLLIVVIFLVRSMTKHLKRVPASFDNDATAERPGEPAAEQSSASAPEPAAKGKNAATGKNDEERA